MIDTLGWTPNKGKPITGQSSHPRVHLPNQRHGMLDKLSHNAHKPDKLSQGAIHNTLNKRGCKSPNPQTSRAPSRKVSGDKLSCIKQRTSRSTELQDQLQTTLQEARQEA